MSTFAQLAQLNRTLNPVSPIVFILSGTYVPPTGNSVNIVLSGTYVSPTAR